MARRRIKKSRNRKSGGHRQAPRPTTWDCPRGNCRFCGEPIVENGKQNNRKHWHQKCADIWKIANNPTDARKHMFLREQGKCETCEFTSIKMIDFQVDHIVPLFEANGKLVYYTETNMQLLCKSCHADKTKIDMIRYRATKGLES